MIRYFINLRHTLAFLISLSVVLVSGIAANSQGANWRINGNAGTNPDNNFLGTTDNQNLAIGTGGQERVRVRTNGNVGINEQTPRSRLVLRNDSLFQRPLMSVFAGDRRTMNISSAGSVEIDPAGAGVALRVRASTEINSPVPFYVTGQDNVNAIYVTRDGNTGLGAAGEGITDRLRVRGRENNGVQSTVRIISGNQQQTMLLDGNEIDGMSHGLYLNHNSSQNVRLATGGGDVGIGVTNPVARLDIRGLNDGTDVQVTDDRFARMRLIATDPANDVRLSVQARGSPGAQRAEIGTVSNHGMVLFTNGAIHLRIGADGTICLGNC